MKYKYWFANIEGISNKKKIDMIEYSHEPEYLYKTKASQLSKMPNITKIDLKKIEDSIETWEIDKEYHEFNKKNISLITWQSKDYPEKLKNIYNPPYNIYLKGNYRFHNNKTVAIIGARACSEYGRTVARKLSEYLSGFQVDIISGMAEGIDTAGHIGAMEGKGKTIAVLGSGVEVCYPKKNIELYHKIQQYGCVISELSIHKQPQPKFFPMRNRLISGLADIVVVVEAREKSGSLITADFALEQGKDVYAVPGRVYDVLSRGTNNLIKQGAGILSSFQELLVDLKIIDLLSEKNNNFVKFPLEKSEKLVYSCVDLNPKSFEKILYETNLELPELVLVLTKLQLKGYIKEVYKNYYITQSLSIHN